jgi:hypothetical protein
LFASHLTLCLWFRCGFAAIDATVSVEPGRLSYNLTQGRLRQPFAGWAVTTVT